MMGTTEVAFLESSYPFLKLYQIILVHISSVLQIKQDPHVHFKIIISLG